jgi:hypothetical protein
MSDEKWRAAKHTHGPNKDGFYSAGIDTPYFDGHGQQQWHLHAIEFHSETKAEAEGRRDLVMALLVEARKDQS